MPPKRNSASAASASDAPAMNQAAIRQLVVDNVAAALKAQAANMANANDTNRNPKPREAHVARKCSYKEFMSCQTFNFKGSKGAVGLICWFERTELVFSHSNCIEDCKVKFATEELSTTATTTQIVAATTTKTIATTATMITASNRPKDKKLSGLMLLPQLRTMGMLETIPCVRNAPCITHDLALLSVILATMWVTRNCKSKGPATRSNLLPMIVTCHACEETGHYANQCQKTNNNNAQGRTYMLRDRNAHRHPNIPFTISKGLTETYFDVVIGMDWLSKHHAKIICDEKVVHIPIDDETLIIQVRDIPDVFPEDLHGLPPVLQVEFQIDLIPGAAPVAHAPYRLAPLEMQELSDQL
nr:reverse transcriptase domain-containing protein [Tanacetum cinerariifolium]